MVSALPSSAIKEYFGEHRRRFGDYLAKGIPFVSLSKGMDPTTLELSDDLFFSIFHGYRDQFTFLSGPSFANEIMEEQITLVSLAGLSRSTLERVVPMFETPFFKAFACLDVKGALLGGALKNVLAIGGGIIQGLGFNCNTRAALITRGIAEMLLFGKIFGARSETFYGLSGMGDLILTTEGASRNKSFGLQIARGRRPENILREDGLLVEGHKTCKAIYDLARKQGIRVPICTGLYNVLYNNKDPQKVIEKLMSYPTFFKKTE